MIYPTRKSITIRGPLAPSDWEHQQYIDSIGEIDERSEWLEYQLEREAPDDNSNDVEGEEYLEYLDEREEVLLLGLELDPIL